MKHIYEKLSKVAKDSYTKGMTLECIYDYKKNGKIDNFIEDKFSKDTTLNVNFVRNNEDKVIKSKNKKIKYHSDIVKITTENNDKEVIEYILKTSFNYNGEKENIFTSVFEYNEKKYNEIDFKRKHPKLYKKRNDNHIRIMKNYKKIHMSMRDPEREQDNLKLFEV